MAIDPKRVPPHDSQDAPACEWHRDVLAERISAVKEGRTQFIDWETAKRQLREHL